jgi:hypothetical protein
VAGKKRSNNWLKIGECTPDPGNGDARAQKRVLKEAKEAMQQLVLETDKRNVKVTGDTGGNRVRHLPAEEVLALALTACCDPASPSQILTCKDKDCDAQYRIKKPSNGKFLLQRAEGGEHVQACQFVTRKGLNLVLRPYVDSRLKSAKPSQVIRLLLNDKTVPEEVKNLIPPPGEPTS